MYNASEDELDFDRRVFGIFRQEIERSESGWIEIIPLPGNENIVFLKGEDGAFDWVVRDQRDNAFTGNPYHPILRSQAVPTAMMKSGLNAHLYFKTGEWYERLEHSAETRHYAEVVQLLPGPATPSCSCGSFWQRAITTHRRPSQRDGVRRIFLFPTD